LDFPSSPTQSGNLYLPFPVSPLFCSLLVPPWARWPFFYPVCHAWSIVHPFFSPPPSKCLSLQEVQPLAVVVGPNFFFFFFFFVFSCRRKFPPFSLLWFCITATLLPGHRSQVAPPKMLVGPPPHLAEGCLPFRRPRLFLVLLERVAHLWANPMDTRFGSFLLFCNLAGGYNTRDASLFVLATVPPFPP